jgi:hypothetical protein
MLLQTFDDGSIFAPDNRNAPYDVYDCRAYYVWRTGLAQLPIAGPPTGGATLQAGGGQPGASSTTDETCAIVRLSMPYGRKIVKFRAVRRVLQPVIPAPEPDDDNQVLLSASVRQTGPLPLSDGVNQLYTLTGKYVYALRKPLTGETGFPGISIPPTKLTPEQNALPAENLKGGIV